jgi:hypothetical protein
MLGLLLRSLRNAPTGGETKMIAVSNTQNLQHASQASSSPRTCVADSWLVKPSRVADVDDVDVL